MERYLQCKYLLFFKLSSTSFGIYCLNKLLLLWSIFILKSKSDHITPGQSPHFFWHNRSFIILPHLPIIASFYPHLQSMVSHFGLSTTLQIRDSVSHLCAFLCIFTFPEISFLCHITNSNSSFKTLPVLSLICHLKWLRKRNTTLYPCFTNHILQYLFTFLFTS